jgi:hypothetical protein
VQDIFDAAAEQHKRAGDRSAARRCQGLAVDQTLRMRAMVAGALAKVYWTRRAIDELRRAGGYPDRLEALRQELLSLQDRSLDEFQPQRIKLNVGDIRENVTEVFEAADLPDALLQFARAVQPVTLATLQDNALSARRGSIFASLGGSTHLDVDGKVIAETAAPSSEDDRDWCVEQSLTYLDIWRGQVVNGIIEPARAAMMRRFPIEERHFHPIVQVSAFVPIAHEHLFALGFARMWQGDFGSAAYILIPQLEHALRSLLRMADRDSSTIKPDMIQEDRSLSALFESVRPEIDALLGPDLANDIELLFVQRPGPALRHAVAHGKLGTAACYSPAAIYACWLIYHMVCAWAVDDWEGVVAPAIEAQTR